METARDIQPVPAVRGGEALRTGEAAIASGGGRHVWRRVSLGVALAAASALAALLMPAAAAAATQTITTTVPLYASDTLSVPNLAPGDTVDRTVYFQEPDVSGPISYQITATSACPSSGPCLFTGPLPVVLTGVEPSNGELTTGGGLLPVVYSVQLPLAMGNTYQDAAGLVHLEVVYQYGCNGTTCGNACTSITCAQPCTSTACLHPCTGTACGPIQGCTGTGCGPIHSTTCTGGTCSRTTPPSSSTPSSSTPSTSTPSKTTSSSTTPSSSTASSTTSTTGKTTLPIPTVPPQPVPHKTSKVVSHPQVVHPRPKPTSFTPQRKLKTSPRPKLPIPAVEPKRPTATPPVRRLPKTGQDIWYTLLGFSLLLGSAILFRKPRRP